MTAKTFGHSASTNGQLYNPDLLPTFAETDTRICFEADGLYFAFSGPSKDLERWERIQSSAALYGFRSRGFREERREATSEQEAIDEQLQREIGRED